MVQMRLSDRIEARTKSLSDVEAAAKWLEEPAEDGGKF